jgi:hypothetical protein
MVDGMIGAGAVAATIDAMIDEAVVVGTVTKDGETVTGDVDEMITGPAAGFPLRSRLLRCRGQFFTTSPAVPCWPGNLCSVLRATW